jgi:hypothetical protein
MDITKESDDKVIDKDARPESGDHRAHHAFVV